ncbi:threonine ammonia-lyase IlvA [Nocardioides currus]|uniref:L-threonine dehydratase n=1 Tax=Nocardioides currus TaxID=2133958 RepID=A0A2R7YRG4_9ACTN|nr:threonine ammonia-lyase IlvA [Nocardioides currus]PUA78982.1 hypothetical protein C7S10_21110 [Nocardioides currus]
MAQHWIATRPGGLDVFSFEAYDAAPPRPGEVTIAVRAAGMNPADAKHVARGDEADFPRGVGYEVAGVVSALGEDTEIASGPVAVGDEVLAFRISGGWSSEVTVPARDVFAKPASLTFGEAANLLLAGCTASEMLHVTGVREGDTILVHGASGAVGVSVLQQAAMLGARVIGTASASSADVVRAYGATPVTYGDGLEQRVREAAPDGVAAALDCVGTDEAVDVSLALVADRGRIVTIAAPARASSEGFTAIAGSMPASAAYRDSVRADLVRLAGEGRLVVPVARTFPLADAMAATELLMGGHPGGKLVLSPGPDTSVTDADVEAAAERLRGVIEPTPLQHSARLSALTGWDVLLKREDLQPVRSYKARGAYNLIAQLSDEARAVGVTCASAGNHAQGVAFACARAGVRARVYLPRTTPRQKRERIAALGGDLVEMVIEGDTYDDAAAASAQWARKTGATPVHAFDDPHTIAGQGTVALEVLAQLADQGRTADAIVVPVGGGGLVAGVLTHVAAHSPTTRVVGVEPAGATSMAAALAAGEPVTVDELDSFVDGAAVRRIGDHTLPVVQRHSPDLQAVPEGLVCVEMLDLYQSDGIVAEPAGALATAALRAGLAGEPLAAGSTVVCVLSGGNNDVSRYEEIVERALVFEGLKHYFLVEFPQEPGALRRFLDEVLGPDDDISLFEYVKRSNRETGPALVGIELQDAADYAPLVARMDASALRVEAVAPDSPLFRFVR